MDREPGEPDEKPVEVVPDAYDRVGEGAGFGVGELELPWLDDDFNWAARRGGTGQFASSAQPYGRSRCAGRGDSLQDVGAGERRDHRGGRVA